MKKILYATTALVAASLVAGSVQAAEPLKFGVSGYMKEWFGLVSQKDLKNAAGTAISKNNVAGLNTDSQVTFSGKTTTDSGITVTGVITLDAIQNGQGAGGTAARDGVVDQEYVALGTGLGTVRAGVVQTTNHDMHNDAPDVGIGYNNIPFWVAAPLNTSSFHHTAFPLGTAAGTASGNAGGQQNWSTTSFKGLTTQTVPSVGYISPSFYGFSAGATYIPSGGSASVGPLNTLTANNNAWDTTLAYAGKIGVVDLGADVGMSKIYPGSGVAGALGKNAAVAVPNGYNGAYRTEAYNGGMKLGYAGFTLSGSYMRMMERGVNRPGLAAGALGPRLTGSNFDAGLSYTADKWAVSGMYYQENHLGNMANGIGNTRNHEELDSYLLSGKYAIGPGINLESTAFYAEYKGKSAAPDVNTKGYGLVSGIYLVF